MLLQWQNENQEPIFADCGKCQSLNSRRVRRRMGCPWVPGSEYPGVVRGAKVETSVCPGYSMHLPQVLNVASLYPHWHKGHLDLALDGETPTSLLMLLLGHYSAAVGSAEAYFMQPPDKRG